MTDRVYINRVEYGPRPMDSRVVLSDGRELSGIESVEPHKVDANNISLIRVNLTAILSPENTVKENENDDQD